MASNEVDVEIQAAHDLVNDIVEEPISGLSKVCTRSHLYPGSSSRFNSSSWGHASVHEDVELHPGVGVAVNHALVATGSRF